MDFARILLNAGHGQNNATEGVYDPGAQSPFGEEHATVAAVASGVAASPCSHPVILTPAGLPLSKTIAWINKNAHVDDILISLHMNQGGASGSEVLVFDGSSSRHIAQAYAIGKAVADTLGIHFRGVKLERDTPRKKEGIVRYTAVPAFLIELGFIDSGNDVAAVKKSGVAAVLAGIAALEKAP